MQWSLTCSMPSGLQEMLSSLLAHVSFPWPPQSPHFITLVLAAFSMRSQVPDVRFHKPYPDVPQVPMLSDNVPSFCNDHCLQPLSSNSVAGGATLGAGSGERNPKNTTMNGLQKSNAACIQTRDGTMLLYTWGMLGLACRGTACLPGCCMRFNQALHMLRSAPGAAAVSSYRGAAGAPGRGRPARRA